MAFHARGRWGGDERNPPVERLRELLQELDIEIEDIEHPDVALTHETEWCLGAYPSGLLVWENLEDGDPNPRHMNGVSREKVLALWLKLAEGDMAAVEAEPWLPGYGPPIEQPRGARSLLSKLRRSKLASDRKFCEFARSGARRGTLSSHWLSPRRNPSQCAVSRSPF